MDLIMKRAKLKLHKK